MNILDHWNFERQLFPVLYDTAPCRARSDAILCHTHAVAAAGAMGAVETVVAVGAAGAAGAAEAAGAMGAVGAAVAVRQCSKRVTCCLFATPSLDGTSVITGVSDPRIHTTLFLEFHEKAITRPSLLESLRTATLVWLL